MVLLTAACLLAGFASLVGPALSLVASAVGLMILPAVGALVSDLGRRRNSESLIGLGHSITWLWLVLMVGFLVLLMWVFAAIPTS
jgi:hypothetical protein